MALTQRIRVTFASVDVKKAGELWGPAEWSFGGTVAGTAVGEPAARFPVVDRSPIDLPDAPWSTIVDVTALEEVAVEFVGTAHREEKTKDLGKVKWKMRFPFSQREQLVANKHFAVHVRVELEVGGAFGPHAGGAIFACREVKGSTIWSTVSGGRFVARLEFCEVRPGMPDAAMPARPKQPPGVAGPVRNRGGHRLIRSTDPINLITNPSVIPVLAKADATATTAATIECSYYRPSTLAFTNDDARLEWSQKSLVDGGAVEFLTDPKGLRVQVYGKKAGEVLLEVRMEGVLLATYRALVRPMKDIVCRFNILNGPVGAIPRSRPEDVDEHRKIANIFLRQIGLQLTLDTDATMTDSAVATAIPGIFRISVSAGTTANVAAAKPRACRLNYRAGVMNFAYIFSCPPLAPGVMTLGMATDIPGNTSAPTISETGTPSTSWKKPSGISPDKAAKAVNMRLFRADQRAGHPQLFSMFVTDANGNPANANDALTYAGTIAHELGHVLGLRHRVGAGHDGLLHPWSENVMHGTNPSTIAQDLDILQARAVLGSPAVT